jgi:hypothetical protein
MEYHQVKSLMVDVQVDQNGEEFGLSQGDI